MAEDFFLKRVSLLRVQIILNQFVNDRWCTSEVWYSEVESNDKSTAMVRYQYCRQITVPNLLRINFHQVILVKVRSKF
jgi:hypothetical protein